MAEIIPNPDNQTARRLRRFVLTPLIAAGAIILPGSLQACSSEKRKLEVPASYSHKSGIGDAKIRLALNPVPKKDSANDRVLNVGINIGCEKSGQEVTRVTVEGVVGGGLETSTCNSPQSTPFIIPPGDELYTAKEVTLDVNTKADLHWIVGVERIQN